MRIIGPDDLVFGVDNLEDCRTYLSDYGLKEVVLGDGGYRFDALDGTSVTLRNRNDPALPSQFASGSTFRQTIWGCEDQATVDQIAAELERDRPVERRADGSIATADDVGFSLVFRVTTRRPVTGQPERINSPGASPGRRPNEIGADETADALPITLSHAVLFAPELEKAEAFYVNRLKFSVVDRLVGAGPFLRPQANDDHHCLFLIGVPAQMQGLEHFAFHVQGPSALLLAGTRFVAKGYESFWGPGRHLLGSNWFWYFNSPMGVHVEYDADMDKHDSSWKPRDLPAGADSSQIYLFENVRKWAPGEGPPERH